MKKIHITYKRIRKIHFYYTCLICGAHLDPGESCDCEKGGSKE